MNPTVVWQILMLSLAVSAISTTVALSSIFGPFRRWAKLHLGKVARVFQCAYCFSHWVTLFAVAWFHPVVFSGWWLANYVVVVFAVVAVANIVTGVLRKLTHFGNDPSYETEELEVSSQARSGVAELHSAPDPQRVAGAE